MPLPPQWDLAPLRDVVVGGRVSCSLEEAALVLARQEYPELDPSPWLERLEAHAALARGLLSDRPDPAEVVGLYLIGVGLIAAWASTRLMESRFFSVLENDTATLVTL